MCIVLDNVSKNHQGREWEWYEPGCQRLRFFTHLHLSAVWRKGSIRKWGPACTLVPEKTAHPTLALKAKGFFLYVPGTVELMSFSRAQGKCLWVSNSVYSPFNQIPESTIALYLTWTEFPLIFTVRCWKYYSSLHWCSGLGNLVYVWNTSLLSGTSYPWYPSWF